MTGFFQHLLRTFQRANHPQKDAQLTIGNTLTLASCHSGNFSNGNSFPSHSIAKPVECALA